MTVPGDPPKPRSPGAMTWNLAPPGAAAPDAPVGAPRPPDLAVGHQRAKLVREHGIDDDLLAWLRGLGLMLEPMAPLPEEGEERDAELARRRTSVIRLIIQAEVKNFLTNHDPELLDCARRFGVKIEHPTTLSYDEKERRGELERWKENLSSKVVEAMDAAAREKRELDARPLFLMPWWGWVIALLLLSNLYFARR